MRMTIKQLDELVKLLELFEKDETIKQIIEKDDSGKLKASINNIKEICIDIIV